MKTVKANCKQCNKEFFPLQKEVNRGKGLFCSRSCLGKHNVAHRDRDKPLYNAVCSLCTTPFYRATSKLQRPQSGKVFCSRACKDLAQKAENLTDFNPLPYTNGSTSYRRRALDYYDNQCSLCGYKKYPQVLHVHHIDGDRANSNIENLIILCPTCHTEKHFENKTSSWRKTSHK